MGKRTIRLALAAVLALYATPGLSQTVVNPRTVEFDPSADHSAVSSDGVALVQRYDLAIYPVGVATAQYSANLGKPTPGADGKVRVDFASLLPVWPLPNGTYEARVAAFGPGGAGQSDPSNQFAFQSCSFGVSPPTLSLGTAGGAASVVVTTDTTCPWTTASAAPWIAVSQASGTGPGTVTLTVSPNGTAAPRSGTVTVAGQTVTVSQQAAAPSCAYSLGSSSQWVPAAGGNGTTGVTTSAGCAWTAASGASWLTVSPSGGTGPGTVSFTAAANTTGAARTSALVIGGLTFSVTQGAAATEEAPSCMYALGSTSLQVGYVGATSSVSLSCPSGCPWSSVSNAAWVTVDPGNGSSPGSVRVTVAPNSGSSSRAATVTIGGVGLTVNQDGKPRPNTPKGLRVVPKPRKEALERTQAITETRRLERLRRF